MGSRVVGYECFHLIGPIIYTANLRVPTMLRNLSRILALKSIKGKKVLRYTLWIFEISLLNARPLV